MPAKSKLKVTPSSGNVFRDLGFSEEEAEHLVIRAARSRLWHRQLHCNQHFIVCQHILSRGVLLRQQPVALRLRLPVLQRLRRGCPMSSVLQRLLPVRNLVQQLSRLLVVGVAQRDQARVSPTDARSGSPFTNRRLRHPS